MNARLWLKKEEESSGICEFKIYPPILFFLSQKERKEFVGVKWRKNVKNTRKECELKGRQWRE
jgi:hypothetical protein